MDRLGKATLAPPDGTLAADQEPLFTACSAANDLSTRSEPLDPPALPRSADSCPARRPRQALLYILQKR